MRDIEFATHEQTYGSYGIDYHRSDGNEVKTIAIDDLNIDKPISFMKFDIQGADLFGMQGAIKTIKKNRMPILFEYESSLEGKVPVSFQDYIDFVKSIGYIFSRVPMPDNFLILPKEGVKT